MAPQRSSIELQLSDAQQAELNKKIGSGKWTVLGLTELLGEWGFEISKSSVHRYMQNVEADAQALRESRMIVETLGKELGESENLGEQGRLLVEMVRHLAFDMLRKVRQDGGTLSPKEIAMLGKGFAEMGRALRFDQDFETKIREQVAKQEREKAANEVKSAGRKAGLSEEAIKEIQQRIIMG